MQVKKAVSNIVKEKIKNAFFAPRANIGSHQRGGARQGST